MIFEILILNPHLRHSLNSNVLRLEEYWLNSVQVTAFIFILEMSRYERRHNDDYRQNRGSQDDRHNRRDDDGSWGNKRQRRNEDRHDATDPLEEKPYICEPCKASFNSRSKRNEHKMTRDHLRTAADYSITSCHICKLEFKYVSEYLEHTKNSISHRRLADQLVEQKSVQRQGPML